jgi:ABC-type glutathione transport system ATPase component
MVQFTMQKPYINSFLPVEAKISVTQVFITANMKNAKSHCKQEVGLERGDTVQVTMPKSCIKNKIISSSSS